MVIGRFLTLFVLFLFTYLTALSQSSVYLINRELSVDNPDTLGVMIYANIFGKTEYFSFDKDVLRETKYLMNKAGIITIDTLGPIPPRVPCIRIKVDVFSLEESNGKYKMEYMGNLDFLRYAEIEYKNRKHSVLVPVYYEPFAGNEESAFPINMISALPILEKISSSVKEFLLLYLAANKN